MAQKVIVKKRRRIRWKVVIPTLVACVLVVYLFGSLVGKIIDGISQDKSSFSVCKLSNKKLQKMYKNKEYEGAINVSDYVIYGENLNLYSDAYLIGGRNAFAGKTMILKNISSVTIRRFMKIHPRVIKRVAFRPWKISRLAVPRNPVRHRWQMYFHTEKQ